MKIDRDFAKRLGDEIAAALQAVADKHDLVLTDNGGSFTSSSYRPKISFGTKTDEGRPAEWDSCSRQFGFAPEDWNRTFIWRGRVFRISGISVTRFRFPIQAIREDGVPFHFSAAHVKELLDRARKNTAPPVD